MGMIPWTGACVTVLLGGRISDLLLKRTGSLKIARSWFAAGCLLATALCFMLVSQAQSVFAVIALMTLANALNALPNPCTGPWSSTPRRPAASAPSAA